MPGFVDQEALTNNNGVVASIGMMIGGQPAAIVLPMVSTGTPPPTDQDCASCNAAIVQGAFDALQALLSEDCYISHVSCVGMTDGQIPSRIDFLPVTYPGTNGAKAMPQQVAALVTMYESSSGRFGDDKTRVAHQYIPGLPKVAFDEGVLIPEQLALVDALFTLLIEDGITEDVNNTTWKRYLATPWRWVDEEDESKGKYRPSDIQVPRIGYWQTRSYVATQKRRLLPHL